MKYFFGVFFCASHVIRYAGTLARYGTAASLCGSIVMADGGYRTL
jgi:hypothetical protein